MAFPSFSEEDPTCSGLWMSPMKFERNKSAFVRLCWLKDLEDGDGDDDDDP